MDLSTVKATLEAWFAAAAAKHPWLALPLKVASSLLDDVELHASVAGQVQAPAAAAPAAPAPPAPPAPPAAPAKS